MTDEELKQLVASLAINQQKMAEEAELSRRKMAEEVELSRQKMAEEVELSRQKTAKENEKAMKELRQQIGGIANKFGSFTEGLALPSMTKILRDRFKMEVISPSVRVSKDGIDAEIDVLAYANSKINEVYVVEVKSHLREEAITQLNTLMANFRTLFPEHSNKKLYGIIAAVDISEMLKKRVLAAGFYVAKIQDDTFSLDTPSEFQAKSF
jgi:hypothetical protein